MTSRQEEEYRPDVNDKVEMMNDFNLYIEEIKQEQKKKNEEDEKEGEE